MTPDKRRQQRRALRDAARAGGKAAYAPFDILAMLKLFDPSGRSYCDRMADNICLDHTDCMMNGCAGVRETKP